jgi:hypothetical protein
MKLVKMSPAQALIFHGHPREALQHLGDSPADRFHRAICHRHLGELDRAEALMSDLLSDPDPRLPLHSLWNTYGMIKTDLGHFWAAVIDFQKAFQILAETPNPQICSYDGNAGGPQISLNLAYSLMRLGRFAEAWPLWESSRHGWSWATPLVPWAGEPGRVLVVPEGGVGDQILFSRWISEVEDWMQEERGESYRAELTYYVHEELIDILPRSLQPSHVIPKPRSVSVSTDPYPNINWDKFDFGTSVMSLPAICGMKSVADIPRDSWQRQWTYQFPWRAGLCWAAEESGLVQRKTRSIPVDDLEPLRAARSSWVSLCPGRPHPDWIQRFEPASWADTKEVLESLDFLVSCDTAVAHLAGALGVTTYLILPLASDWKYFTYDLVGNQSPWYPSVKLVRNSHPVSFKPAIELLMEELKRDGRI